MAETFPKQEEKLVNDNGTLKWLQRTIYTPGDTGMVVVSPTHRTRMRYGGARMASTPTGLVPIEDSIEVDRYSSNPTEIGNWIPTTYNGEPEKTKQKGRDLWNLVDVRQQQNGGWLSKFDLGGTVQQPESDKQKRMKELLLIINGAAKELSTKQPGDNVVYLAQVMQDPQDAELLEAIVLEMPDAQEIIDQVSQLSSQMFKCGGKTKKKVKKGAKGCVPCKKLMKVGGRLINVLTDCEGNIISKHQVGGWLIPKGENGLETKYKVSSAYRTNKTGTGTKGQQHYFIGADGNLYHQQVNDSGLWDLGTLVTSGFDDENFNNWSNSLGADSSFWATGFNKDKNTFDTEANARAAMGNAYDAGVITGQTVHGVTATGNKYIGDTPDKLKVTADLYVQHHGGWQNAMQAEDDILKAKRRASRKLASLQRQNMRDLFRDFESTGQGSAQLDLNGDGTVGAGETFTNRSAALQAIRNSRKGYMKEARQARTANLTAILGTLAPLRGTIAQNSLKMQTPSGGTTLSSNDVIVAKKQGGWLTKFEDGGMVKGWYVIPGNDHISEVVSYRPFSLDFIKKAVGVTPGELNPNYRNRTVIKYTATRPGPFEKNKEWEVEKITFDPNKQLPDTTNYSMYVPYPNPNPMRLTK